MGRVFWAVLSLLLAVSVHLGYMLYAPSHRFAASLAALTKDKPGQAFAILTPEQQAKLLPYATPGDVVGVCFFDLSRGNLKIEGHAPEGFWNFAIFTNRGRQVYDLNDTQVESNTFVVELQMASSILKQILGNADGGDATTQQAAGWQVRMTEQQGLAILWSPLRDALKRNEVQSIIKTGTCKLQ